jgi:tol-pal system protein YbgF
MRFRPTPLKALAVVALLAATAPAARAQDTDASRRLDRLEKQVRELRAILFQGRDTGQPVEVKPAGPDPAVTALQTRLDAMDDQLRQVKGQLEVLTHDADEARQTSASVRDEAGELKGELKDLSDRVARLEGQGGVGLPPAPGAIPPPPTPAPVVPPQDATAAAQASDAGRLGGPTSGPAAPPPPAAPPSTPAAAYRAAHALITSGDYAGASNAFQDYLTRYPSAKNAPEANYWLGESDYAREDYQDATPAYARALKGWPHMAWAADATVKLARSLAETSRGAEACAALSEFDHRYRTLATPAVKSRADGVRAAAHCGG